MLVCKECGEVFEDPNEYVNRHVPENYLYNEHYTGCPYCGGAYVEAQICDCCGDYITGDFVVIDDQVYCDNCFTLHNISEL